ncbi:MAG: tetratricopeptide repeat protein [Alphaproteobacteria bacterium]|nr:tetratricopeptide repeat protein [Alphaproteobacteria bacterium]
MGPLNASRVEADTTPSQAAPARGATPIAIYDGFISYSHARDRALAASLQGTMQRLGKPWYRRRALRLFRDDTSLSASPHLWPSIEYALQRSRFLILMASPEAAASPWVDREVAWWLDHRGPDTLLIALSDGELAWDPAARDFAASPAMPLPPALRARGGEEPFWIDLRAYRKSDSRRDSRFAQLAANFAATIRGVPKEDLLSEEVRQQRRALRLAGLAAVLLAVLLGLAAWQWQVAWSQRDRAEHTVATATATATNLIFDLEMKFRDAGIPSAAIDDLLSRIRALQEQLIPDARNSPELGVSRASGLLQSADNYLTRGDTKSAFASAEQARAIMAPLLAAAPENSMYRFLLSVGVEKTGEAMLAQGDVAGTLAAHHEALTLRKALAIAEPANPEWQTNLSISQERIGDALAIQGDPAGALAAYRDALAIRKDLARSDPGNRRWQRNLSVIDDKIGEMLTAQGDLAAALSAYRDGLAIVQVIAETDPGNTLWRRDLAVSYTKIGAVLEGQGDLAGALAAYRDSLATIEGLARTDRGNLAWQRDLAVAKENIGDVLKAQGDLAGALAAYRERLDLARNLAQKDRDNMMWQSDRAIAGHKVASALAGQGALDEALEIQKEAVSAIREAYAAHPAASGPRDELARGLGGLSWLLLLANRPGEALDSTEEALALAPTLLFVRINKAHALLLVGRFEEAYALYSEDKDKPRPDGKTLAAVVREDFAELRKRGIETPAMSRIEALLPDSAPTPR